jgi:O2-independent ubiquinone biosynthesis protein UbiV
MTSSSNSFSGKSPGKLTLGPLLFHWSPEKRRDFYFRIADEAAVDCVYLGEVVCSKREPFFAPHSQEVVHRLVAAGKQVVRSTLALMTLDREVAEARALAESGALVEANDVACLQAIAGRPHVIGPYINVFNEGTQDVVIRDGALRVVLPVEANATTVRTLAARSTVETELLVFGRQPLSVAMRCYHARSHELTKDSCQFVCGRDPDGLAADTLDGTSLLTINGTQTLSNGYLVLLQDLAALRRMGVTHFRLSPQDVDMVAVARTYRAVLDRSVSVEEAANDLRGLTGEVPWQNGFLHGREGLAWVDRTLEPA